MADTYVLWGGTGQAKVLHEMLQRQGHRVAAVVDKRNIPSPLKGIPLLVGLAAWENWLMAQGETPLCGLAAMGGQRGQDRLEILRLFHSKSIATPSIIHTTAFVALDASLGEGSQILAQSAVCTQAQLGRAVIVNTSASVDHDCCLEDGVHIGPGAHLAGEVHIGSCAFIGTGAVILPGIRVGEHALVGAGAVVTKDVPAEAIVLGVPARQTGLNTPEHNTKARADSE